ncbi:MAG: glycosyltransferase [Lachnospiraceae bacterium]|nr:glycosyltransferase [Lachnospiraceae bacterium]
MAFISVIVPIYNVEKYLSQCLDSLLSQTLRDIEIICVNDGSTDNSVAILEEYARKDSRVHIISKENTGYGHSMNVGMSSATGEYIGIVESDDFVDKDMFLTLYEKAKESNADIVKSDFYDFCNGKIKQRNNLENVSEVVSKSEMPDQRLFDITPSIWSAIYKRSFLSRNNIRFHESSGASYQDVSFAFLCTAYAEKIVLLQEAYLFYRNDNMDSSVKNLSKIYCICDEFAFLEEKIKSDKGISPELINIMVHSKHLRYMWNFHRLLDIDKKDFMRRMSKEFMEHAQSGELQKTYWTETEWKEIHQIIESPEQYVVEHRDVKTELYTQPVINQQIYVEAVFQRMMNSPEIIIYGAGKIGKKLSLKLEKEGYTGKIMFATTVETEGTRSIEQLAEEKKECLVVIAVLEEKQAEMIKMVRKLAYKNVIRLDSLLLSEV